MICLRNSNSGGSFPEILKSYAMPISMPLREDPPDDIRWPKRLFPDKSDEV